jgi:hypothetical protein
VATHRVSAAALFEAVVGGGEGCGGAGDRGEGIWSILTV